MGEAIVSVFVKVVGEKISSLLVSEISLAWGVKKEVKKLEGTVSSIKAVLLDAESQQTKNNAVRDWLQKLKDVVYDVDDEVSTEALRRKVEIQGRMLKEVHSFFSPSNPLVFSFKTVHKIKDIRERLDSIAADRRNFNFSEQGGGVQIVSRQREQTYSFVRESDVIGRDSDRKKIVKLLLSTGHDNESLSVIPIVGIGGLGKTTLAKLVYNDDEIVQNFELRIWVCVTEDFDIKKVVEKIIKSAKHADYGYLDLEQLQTCLRDILNAKKFLLVLDIWNDDPTKWIELKNLLMDGTSGSKIITTTRSKKVASIMRIIPLFELKGLSAYLYL